jgi:hypothetical protein
MTSEGTWNICTADRRKERDAFPSRSEQEPTILPVSDISRKVKLDQQSLVDRLEGEKSLTAVKVQRNEGLRCKTMVKTMVNEKKRRKLARHTTGMTSAMVAMKNQLMPLRTEIHQRTEIHTSNLKGHHRTCFHMRCPKAGASTSWMCRRSKPKSIMRSDKIPVTSILVP